jgi:pimeloyl-ACP methyl ester carboxylesterase
MTEARERRVTARDGTRIFVKDWPAKPGRERPPILCLAGLTRNSADFNRTASDLSEFGHRVVAIDYRGRGRSDRAGDPMSYTPQTYLDDIRNVLTALNLHHVVVLGTSLGGFLAMGLAVAMPGALRAVILNDAGPDLPQGGLERIRGYVAAAPSYNSWDDAVAGFKTMVPDLNLDESGWLEATQGCFTEGDDGRIHAEWDPGIAIPLGRAPLPPLWPLFGALRGFPTLALRGALSDLLTEACFERMAEVHPTLIRATIPNRGHAPTLDEPESRDAIHAFLAALSR